MSNAVRVTAIVLVTVLFCIVAYWFHTNYRCVSSHLETRCTTHHSSGSSFSTTRCREVDVCDDWEHR